MIGYSRKSILSVFHLVTSTATLFRPSISGHAEPLLGRMGVCYRNKCGIREIFTISSAQYVEARPLSGKSRRMAGKNSVPLIRLNNGLDIPSLGLGTWKSKPGEVNQAIKDAIDAGYTHIDCAWTYQNEVDVGEGIKDKIDEGVIKREDLFIVSKLWNTFHRPDQVEVGLRHSLKDLGLDYLDLYLIHWPTAFKEETGERYPRDENGNVIFSNVDFCDTWEAMESLVKRGLVRSIGVSNFNHEQLERLLKRAKIVPVTNQVEVHPYLSNQKLAEFCAQRDITITAYSPLRSPDRLWKDEPTLLEDPDLQEIAQRYNRSVAQVILRWIHQRGMIVIPKSVNKSRIQENINIFDFQLTEDDIKKIFSLNKDRRANPYLEQAGTHKEYPFNLDY